MECFQAVCAKEFSLFFELPAWENIVLQGTVAEPALHHAALAIGALTRSRYYPHTEQLMSSSFSIRHYSMAIRNLHRRLDESSQSLELAILASVFFTYVEFLLALDNQIEVHVKAGSAMIEKLSIGQKKTLAVSTRAGSHSQDGGAATRCELLANGMAQLTDQTNFSMASRSHDWN